jgi:hypothetical protein
VRKRKRNVAAEEVLEKHTKTLVLSKSEEHQSSSDKKTSKRPTWKNKGRELMENVEFQPTKPNTRATNKLRLTSKVVLDPTLKSSVIVLDETSPRPAQKKAVSKVKSKETIVVEKE